jgi:hypothetical protein
MVWLIALFLSCWLIPTAWADTGWGLKRGSNVPVVWNGTDTCDDVDWVMIVNQTSGEIHHCSGQWLSGEGDPPDTTGTDGQLYYDRGSPDTLPGLWGPKTEGSWLGTGPRLLTASLQAACETGTDCAFDDLPPSRPLIFAPNGLNGIRVVIKGEGGNYVEECFDALDAPCDPPEMVIHPDRTQRLSAVMGSPASVLEIGTVTNIGGNTIEYTYELPTGSFWRLRNNAGAEIVRINEDGTMKLALRTHATDCTALTDGLKGQACYEDDSDRIFVCEPTAGGCDTAEEWRLATGGATAYAVYPFQCNDSAATDPYFLLASGSGETCQNDEQTAEGAFVKVTRTGTVKNLYCGVTTGLPPGGSDTVVFTVRIEGVNTGVTCTITGTQFECNNTANTAAITAGQRLSLQGNPSADETHGVICSVEVES